MYKLTEEQEQTLVTYTNTIKRYEERLNIANSEIKELNTQLAIRQKIIEENNNSFRLEREELLNTFHNINIKLPEVKASKRWWNLD